MGDRSRIIITVHPEDEEKFWEFMGEDPELIQDQDWDNGDGSVSRDILEASGGWWEPLEKAAKEGFRFYGEDYGCLGVWGYTLFAAIDGRYSSCAGMDEVGPVAQIKEDGSVSDGDIKSAIDYWAAYLAVKQSIEESQADPELDEAWRDHLKPGDEVTWNDPDDGKCSGVYKIKSIRDWEGKGRYEAIYVLTNEEGSEVEAPGHELS